MSKVPKLSAHDMERISHMSTTGTVQTYLRNQDKTRFNVGDILIRKSKGYDGKIHTEMVSKSSNASKKYICVFVDDLGIPYIKPMRVDGQTSDGVQSVCDMGLNNCWFEADPEYAEHIILSEDKPYDPMEFFKQDKENRAKIKAHNRKIREKTNTRNELWALFKKIQPGSTFYASKERDCCITIDEHLVTEVHKMTLIELRTKVQSRAITLPWNIDQQLDNLKQQYPGTPDVYYVFRVKAAGRDFYITEVNFWRNNIFLQPPKSVKESI